MTIVKKLGVASFAIAISISSASADVHRGGAVEDFSDGYAGPNGEGHRGQYVADAFDNEEGDIAKAYMAATRCYFHNPNDNETVCEDPGESLGPLY